MRLYGFSEDEQLARTALNCHFSMELLCQEMQAAQKVGDVAILPELTSAEYAAQHFPKPA